MKTKEPTPLESLERIYCHLPQIDGDRFKQDKDIIKSALKRLAVYDLIEKQSTPNLELIDGNTISYEGRYIVITNKKQFDKDNKKLKALEVFKECVGVKMSVDGDVCCLYVPLDNDKICLIGYVKGKDKIDSLKEVLL